MIVELNDHLDYFGQFHSFLSPLNFTFFLTKFNFILLIFHKLLIIKQGDDEMKITNNKSFAISIVFWAFSLLMIIGMIILKVAIANQVEIQNNSEVSYDTLLPVLFLFPLYVMCMVVGIILNTINIVLSGLEMYKLKKINSFQELLTSGISLGVIIIFIVIAFI